MAGLFMTPKGGSSAARAARAKRGHRRRQFTAFSGTQRNYRGHQTQRAKFSWWR